MSDECYDALYCHRCKVHQLAEEVLALQRQARDSKSAMAIMAQQAQVRLARMVLWSAHSTSSASVSVWPCCCPAQEKRVAVGSAQQLRLELGEAYAEVARLQALLQASGVRC